MSEKTVGKLDMSPIKGVEAVKQETLQVTIDVVVGHYDPRHELNSAATVLKTPFAGDKFICSHEQKTFSVEAADIVQSVLVKLAKGDANDTVKAVK